MGESLLAPRAIPSHPPMPRPSSGPSATPAKLQRARQLRNAATPAERRLWQAIHNDVLGVRVRRQYVILGWIVDFYIPSAALVIEVDGASHDDRADEDARRTACLAAKGLRVIRFSNEEVEHNLPGVVAAIAAALAAPHGPPTSTP